MIFILNEEELSFNDNKYVLYFYTDELNIHKKCIFNLLKIQKEYNIQIYCIDINKITSCERRYKLTLLPTIILFKDFYEIKRFNHILKYNEFKKQFSSIENDDISL